MGKKGFLIATSAGFAAAAAAVPGAQAADMPIKAPRYVEPAASWAGWYIGAHAGAAWQSTQVDSVNPVYGFNLGGSSFSKTGFIGGGQIGYNWQHGNFVFGLEGDISGLTGKGSGQAIDFSYATAQSQIRWLSTVRSRFGLAVGDTMAYMTAGLAIGGVKNSVNNVFGEGLNYSSSKTKVGWTVGGGVEHMLNRNWTIGLEGLFVDLGKTNVSVPGFKTTRFHNQAVIGRLKLNYKF
jgi:outer membrane immunogenic protein